MGETIKYRGYPGAGIYNTVFSAAAITDPDAHRVRGVAYLNKRKWMAEKTSKERVEPTQEQEPKP